MEREEAKPRISDERVLALAYRAQRDSLGEVVPDHGADFVLNLQIARNCFSDWPRPVRSLSDLSLSFFAFSSVSDLL